MRLVLEKDALDPDGAGASDVFHMVVGEDAFAETAWYKERYEPLLVIENNVAVDRGRRYAPDKAHEVLLPTVKRKWR